MPNPELLQQQNAFFATLKWILNFFSLHVQNQQNESIVSPTFVICSYKSKNVFMA